MHDGISAAHFSFSNEAENFEVTPKFWPVKRLYSGSMAIELLTSIQNNLDYCYNRAYLESALRSGDVQFIPDAFFSRTPEIVFNKKARLYDFTRSARAKVREEMITYLKTALPGLSIGDGPDIQMIRGALNCLFNYQEHKSLFNNLQPLYDEMEMLIFNKAYQYVAHVKFESTSCPTGIAEYTVYAALTCQRYTYFPLQYTTPAIVLQAMQGLFLK